MKKLLQINPVLRTNTSTGRIMQEIGELAIQNGWESYIAYSYGRDGVKPCRSKQIPVGNKWDVALHGVVTRLFDAHGLMSQVATQKLVDQIQKIKPDVIHIHNIHGYFLNYQILFDFLSQNDIPVIWTVHDCWLYTGHCYYYTFIGCNKWQTGCGHCPQQRKFPASWLTDRSRQNFIDKRKPSLPYRPTV
ncbi:glycosyltransferase [Bacteroides thetaiotaomicron]|uniref:glycosyltransferase n=1 Tax=Bacteroides thetaiotaomicron TaxID=818 RepID=UPI00286D79B7|nr:glycosyltransferase [Bacteroides thetaiotaomicron]MCS2261970.1 glycosyltransferase [Bacteroides thetaiotaomicron]